MKIVVIGAGPAGLAAAVVAAENGAEVRLLDENPRPGGQIWRQGPNSRLPKAAARWISRVAACRVGNLFGTTVLGRDDAGLLACHRDGKILRLSYDKIILATGARELFLPFPGWTLPNVLGAGGAQALLKAGMPARGKRVVVAGSGPLLMAVAAAFASKGARVLGILEQAGFLQLLRFAPELLRHPAKLLQGAGFARAFFPRRPRLGAWIVRAGGGEVLREVTATDGTREWTWPCDVLACGFGLTPNLELARALGCRIGEGGVVVDSAQRTSLREVYCAGETTGIGGEDVALLEGEIAALAALGLPAEAKIRERRGWDSFCRNLERAFALRPELRKLPEDGTLVCRCEDVSFGALKNQPDQRTAKLYTRCGMGSCQGRICGPAGSHLFGWEVNKPRWPLSPVPLGALCRE